MCGSFRFKQEEKNYTALAWQRLTHWIHWPNKA